MTTDERRLPSFNDFSPGIVGEDLRPLLRIVDTSSSDEEALDAIQGLLFDGVENKRAKNVRITMGSCGLSERHSWTLSELGREVMTAPTAAGAVYRFCANLYQSQNGDLLVQAVRNLGRVTYRGSFKRALKAELQNLGIEKLSNATTDHTTMANWFRAAGIFVGRGKDMRVDDEVLSSLVNISSEEFEEIQCLTSGQRRFLRYLRMRCESQPEFLFAASKLYRFVLQEAPLEYRDDQMRADVVDPLVASGWIFATGLTGGRGSKSGRVGATKKLLDIPLRYYVDRFDETIPGDVRIHLNTPTSELSNWLVSDQKWQRGLALEIATLRLVLDLGLIPRGFRRRSEVHTAMAEVDLVAEGLHLMFSRWLVQCKHYISTGKVRLEDVAREVGIAVYMKAHVVLVVTTGEYTGPAKTYAEEVTRSTALQIVLIDGRTFDYYLSEGPTGVLDFLSKNARSVMMLKDGQRHAD